MSASTPAESAGDLAVRVAWHYYVEGLTQEQIAQGLAVSRARVVRLLQAARADGTVQIDVGAGGAEHVATERALAARYGLAEAVVVEAHDPARTASAVGAAAGAWLARHLAPGISVGIGWGETLDAAWRAVPPMALEGATVVSLLGSPSLSRSITGAEVARRLAEVLHAQCYQLTAPLLVADAAMRDALWAEPALAALRERAARCDVTMVSVGEVAPEATLFREGLLSPADRQSLHDAGAVGDVLGQFVDRSGAVLDHPVNRRAMGVPLAELRGVRERVLVAGGARKALALRGALAALRPTVLVTDARAAAALLTP